MGELLRAVCDATCIDSNPAWYGARQSYQLAGSSAANAFADRSTFLECKTDTWFLLMGMAQSSMMNNNLAVPVWDDKSQATTFGIRDVKTGRKFNSVDLVQKVDQNFNANNFVTLPEYILFEPSSLIEVIQNVQIATTFVGPLSYLYCVTLAGIEYKLPEGRNYRNGR